MENVVYIAIICLAVIAIVNMILLIISNAKVKKYTKLYEKALAKFNSRENIQDEFNSIYTRLNEVLGLSKKILKILSQNALSLLSLQSSVAPYLPRHQICSSKESFSVLLLHLFDIFLC